MLPTRRIELTVAKVGLAMAQVNGASGLTLSDFLFDPEIEEVAEASAEDAAQFFGFKPRPKVSE